LDPPPRCIPRANFTQAIIDAVRNAKKGTTVGEAMSIKIADAKEKKDKQQGKRNDSLANNISKLRSKGTDTTYTLRRLARDNPAMLDKIEAGELSVNAAAIQAGGL
jgi:hypothetical protein